MVLAGAGTGKTRVLVHRIERLVRDGGEPWAILAVTFTNKAAGEMRHRLRDLLGSRADAMWIGTFHATCARLLRRYGEHVGLTKSFVIFDDDDQIKLVERLLKETSASTIKVSARTILSRFDRAKNRGVDPRDGRGADAFDDPRSSGSIRCTRYSSRRRTRSTSRPHPRGAGSVWPGEARAISTRMLLGRGFATSWSTSSRTLATSSTTWCSSSPSATRNLTVVGDDDQSIYAWRGAEPRNLLDFDRVFRTRRSIKLEQGHSTQMVL